MVTNEGEPLHTVTISTLPPIWFYNSTDAWGYGQSIKDLLPSLRVNITDADGGCVELEENGWVHANA